MNGRNLMAEESAQSPHRWTDAGEHSDGSGRSARCAGRH